MMQKRAIPISRLVGVLKAVSRSGLARRSLTGAIGAGIGGAGGYYVTPHISGYADVPSARRISALSDAAVGGGLGFLMGGRGQAKQIADAIRKLPPLKQLGWAGGAFTPIVGAEIFPIINANQTKQREAAELSGVAARQFGEASKSMSIPNAVRDVIRSGGFKGTVAGAGAAGLAGMLSGMYRPKSRKEIEEDENRTEMMRSDVLRYLLPAMVAGGVIGSLHGRSGQPAGQTTPSAV